MPKLSIGPIRLDTNLLLAPIAGYCDLAFRLIVRRISCPIPGGAGRAGVGLACTDLLCPQALLKGNPKSIWLAATNPQDRPLCMQLYGVDPAILVRAAVWAVEHGASIVDLNMGCPVDKVTKKNGGSKLLCDLASTVSLARQVVNAVDVPVTAKIRLGWDDQTIVAPDLAPALADVGVAAITVHGRTAQQKFRGRCRTDGIARVVEAMGRRHPGVPVVGNGDVKSPHDAKQMINATGCQGVMIGRGALGQPWIFRDTAYFLATGLLPRPLGQIEKAGIVLAHFQIASRLRGESQALHMIRQRISWYSAQLQPWPGLRRQVREICCGAQFQDLMEAGVDRIKSQGVPVTRADAA